MKAGPTYRTSLCTIAFILLVSKSLLASDFSYQCFVGAQQLLETLPNTRVTKGRELLKALPKYLRPRFSPRPDFPSIYVERPESPGSVADRGPLESIVGRLKLGENIKAMTNENDRDINTFKKGFYSLLTRLENEISVGPSPWEPYHTRDVTPPYPSGDHRNIHRDLAVYFSPLFAGAGALFGLEAWSSAMIPIAAGILIDAYRAARRPRVEQTHYLLEFEDTLWSGWNQYQPLRPGQYSYVQRPPLLDAPGYHLLMMHDRDDGYRLIMIQDPTREQILRSRSQLETISE